MSTSGRSEERNSRNMRTQEKPCHLWLQGNCRFGSACKFRHNPEDEGRLKKTARVAMAEERNVSPKESATTSQTSNTDERINVSSVQRTQSRNPSMSVNPRSTHIEGTQRRITNFPGKTKMCRDWKAGRCPRGEKCRFRHDDQENAGEKETPSQAAKEAETRAKEDREAREKEEAQEHARRQVQAERHREAERQRQEERMARERAAREAREEVLRRERERRMEEERRRNAERMAMEEEARKKRQMEMQACREQDAKVIEQHLILDSSLVTFGAGLDIRNIVAGFDLCTIKIKNLPRNAKREEIADLFIQQGIQQSDFYISHLRPILNNLEAVVLANSEYGHAITVGLEGIPFRNNVLTFSIDDNAIGNSMDTATRNSPFVIVTWRTPSDTVVAGYRSMEEAQKRAHQLNMTTWKGRQIRAVMNERPQGVVGLRNFNPASVKFMNLPSVGYVPHDLYELTGTTDHKLLKSASFNVEESFRTIRAHFSKLSGVQIDTYEIMTTGTEDSCEAKVKVQFEEWEDAKEAHASVSQMMGGMNRPSYRAWLPPKPLRYTIKIPLQQYEAQKRQWDELSKTKAGSDAHVQHKVGSRGDIFIQVLGQDKKAAGSLKVRVESMVSGEKLAPEYWHSSWMANSARAFFARIFDEKKVFIWNDVKTRSLRVYGEPQLVAEARQMIKGEVDRLAQRETTRFLDPGSIGFFVRVGLGKLVELLGEENVNLNLASRPCRITIKGGDEAKHHLQRMIDESRAAGPLASVLPYTAEKETCPICTDEASHPEQLVCGHTYCAGCLKHFLTSAVDAKTFPLVCMGNNATCNVPIAIPFIRRFLPQTIFVALVEAAFVSYLDQHPQEWKYCTTPDCKQIYRHRTEKATLQCPSCFLTICPACNEEAHEGMTCEERRILKNPAEQERLNEELAKNSGFKKCPQCNVWIEKTEGCNHMSCKCGAHICWQCMAISDQRGAFTAGTIYDHMQSAHGGIHEEVPAGINLGHIGNRAFLAEQMDELARIERQRLAAQAQAEAEAARVQRIRQVQNVNAPVIPFGQHHEQNERIRLAAAEVRRARIMEQYRIAREQQDRQEAQDRNRREAEERAARALMETPPRLRREEQEFRREEQDRSWCVVM